MQLYDNRILTAIPFAIAIVVCIVIELYFKKHSSFRANY